MTSDSIKDQIKKPKMVPVLKKGVITEVEDNPDKVRYEFVSPNQFFSNVINLLPMQNSVTAARAFYEHKFITQALPIKNGESPNVQSLKDADKNESVTDLSKVEQHDLVKYGLMPELIGRLPIITALNPLSEDDLVHILTEPKNAIIKQYQELLSMDGVKLEFEDEALRKIAELAIQKKTGARGLRSIIESAMQKVMFDVPDMSSAKKVVITAECVEGKADALVYGARNKKIA